MEEENVSDGARHDGLDRGLEYTKECSANEERGVRFRAGDTQPDTRDDHQERGEQVHRSPTIFYCEGHPDRGGHALAHEGRTIGVCKLLERPVEELRALHHPGGHDGTRNCPEEGVGQAIGEGGPFLKRRPTEWVVWVAQGRLGHEENVAVAFADVLEEVEVLRYGAMFIFLVVEDFCSGGGFEDRGDGVDG